MEKYQVGVVIMLSLIIGVLLGMAIMGEPIANTANTTETVVCQECTVTEVIKEVEVIVEVEVIKEIIKEVCPIDIAP